jgi:hypothetical protein
MSKRKPVFKKVKLELTQDIFYIIVANDIKEGFELLKTLDSNLKDYCLPEANERCPAICWPNPLEFGVAVLFKYQYLKASYITHEVSHATHAILQHIELKLNNETDEVYAYHNDMLFRYCTDFMKENKLRIKV